MRTILLALVVIPSVRAQDVMDIVHAYSAHEISRLDRTRDYTYQHDLIRRRFKRDGTLRSATIETYEVLIANGKQVRKLIRRNGISVTEQDARKTQQRLDEVSARVRLRSMENRFDTFALEGEEDVDGRRAWIVSAKKSMYGIARIQAKFWIDEADYECAKVQSEGRLNIISIDGRANGLMSSVLEYTRMADGVWLPKHAVYRNDARLPLTVFPISIVAQSQAHWELESTFFNYKKFQSDSHILSLGKP